MKENGRDIYKNCSKAIRGQFNDLYPKLEAELNESTGEATSLLLEDFGMMMENHTAKNISSAGVGGGVCSEKVKLRDEVGEVFIRLREVWSKEVAEEVKEEFEESEDEKVDISKFKKEANDDDDDAEPISISDNDSDEDYDPDA